MKRNKLLLLILCLLLTAGVFSGCGASSKVKNTGSARLADHLTTAASYDEIQRAIKDAMTRQEYGGREYALDGAVQNLQSATGTAGAPAAMPVPAVDESVKSAGAQSSTGGGYSQTNVQVQGVDEGDIVKTDGQYIYILRQNQLIIFKADGVSTTQISTLKIGIGNVGGKPMPYDQNTPESKSFTSENASDIYVAGNTAVVVTSFSSYMPYVSGDSYSKADIAPVGDSKQISKVYMIDITDRTNPALKAELGQDGNVLTSRLVGQTLYLISNYYVYNMREGDSGTFVPRLYAGAASTAVSYKCISIMPYLNSTAYSVICSYDLDKGVLQNNQSVLGGGTTVYMNKDTLYLASSSNRQTAGAPYTDSIYSVIDYTMTAVTDVVSFELTNLTMKASGTVQGSLYGQFALDEWEGYLRVAATTFNQSWSEYTDKVKGFVNYIWKDPSQANALYVLDGSLKAVGSIRDLAPGEQVYSVRFDGPTGYIVTFRQVDPLFAVDLSDPANPAVKSALKIPGFSEYLHIYSDGRLFGLGMDADENTGRTNGMKLTMFDTTIPDDVTVKHSLKLDTDWSAALYNHKAILISPDKGIIAFPADNGYDIYGYSDDLGFKKRAHIDALQWTGDSRGLYIGEIAYIVDSTQISILDMTDFKLLGRISY